MFEVPEDEDDEGFYEQELVNLPVYLLVKVPEGENPVNNPKAGKPLGKGYRSADHARAGYTAR